MREMPNSRMPEENAPSKKYLMAASVLRTLFLLNAMRA